VITGRQRGWIGIDLGTQVVKLAQLVRVGGRLRSTYTTLDRRASARGPAESENAADRPFWSGGEIRRALDLHGGFRGRSVACTLPMSWTDLRPLTVPPGNESERRAMIAQELESVYGENDKPREFDFWETDAATQGDPIAPDGVQVLSIARKRVTELGESLSQAGLDCRVLDGLPCALARALTLARPGETNQPSAAIDWGVTNATFCIVQRGQTQFTRNLRDCGAGALVAQVGQTLGLTQLEGGQLLQRWGLPRPGTTAGPDDEIQEVIASVVDGHLRRLLEELVKTLAYLRAQRPGLLPKQLWLFGGGATVKNAAAFLASKLEIPCEVWRLPGGDETGGGNSTDAGQSAGGEGIFGPAVALSALAWNS
jgi:Tfp pilus assembly PilM family ATPase